MNKEIIPVIHYIDHEQLFYNINVCVSLDIKKVFLINHAFGSDAVVKLCTAILDVKEKYPNLWVGVNFLGVENVSALILAHRHGADAIWCDNAHLCERDQDAEAKNLWNMILDKGEIEYFGGVEFKYQKQPKNEDLVWVYEHACKYMDVITTSGEGTGKEIDLNKLKRIRESIGENEDLAVASGVNKHNIKAISEYANYFMVASSITEPNSEFIIIEALKQLKDNLND